MLFTGVMIIMAMKNMTTVWNMPITIRYVIADNGNNNDYSDDSDDKYDNC